MIETLAIAFLTLAGIGAISARTDLGWYWTAALGPVVGITTHVLFTTVAVSVVGRTEPRVTVLAAGGALIATAARRTTRRELARARPAALAALVALGAISVVVHLALPVRLTPDSAQYIAIADIAAEPGGIGAIPAAVLVKRGLGTAALQMLGALDGRPFAVAATTVMTASGFAVMGVAIWHAARERVSMLRPAAWIGLALAFAVTANRPLYDAFYVNSHGPVMACLLVIVLGGFFARERPAWLVAVALCASFVVVARPEGAITAAIAMMPALVSPEISTRWRLGVALPPAITTLMWHGLVLWDRAPGERFSVVDDITIGCLAGFGLLALALMPNIPRIGRLARFLPWSVVAAMGLGLGIMVLSDRSLALESVSATAQNLISEGLWGLAWPALGVLLVGAFLSGPSPERTHFEIPIAGFGVLYWLLPYVRSGPYRVGGGDSGNRILAHIFLVALTYVVLVAIRESQRSVSGSPSLPAAGL